MILFVFFVLPTIGCFGQKEDAVWYFGQFAGLDFRSGSPVALTNGAMYSSEGCDAMCDKDGNLLFYTDGVNVWNKDHQVMANGSGLNGKSSSTQSVAIAQMPGNDSIFYVFTTSEYGVTLKGLYYSVVDMRPNGGMGAVTTKNVRLLDVTTEKVNVVRHRNCKYFWIITHGWNSNTFYAFLLTDSGVQATPVTTDIGTSHKGLENNKVGCLKSSLDGKTIAAAVYGDGFVEILDFDYTSGTLSNCRKLASDLLVGAYGVEFSPDKSKLYITTSDFGMKRSCLYQIDLTLGNPGTMLSKMVTLSTKWGNYYYGTLQIAYDNKIYAAKYDNDSLAVINDPNNAGAGCNFVNEGIYLKGKKSWMGLPQYVQPSYYPEVTYTNSNPVCYGDTINFEAEYQPDLSYAWTGPGGFASTLRNPAIYGATPENEGEYTLEIFYSKDYSTMYKFNVEVIDNRFGIDGTSDRDFGKICTGLSVSKDYTVSNTGTDPIIIDSLLLAGKDGAYTLALEPPVGTTLNPGEQATLTVKFTPQGCIVYNNWITLKTKEPCTGSIAFDVTGTGTNNNTIAVPDTVCVIGDRNFVLPLYSTLGCSETMANSIAYNARISFDADAFAPDENNPIIKSRRIENGRMILELASDGIVHNKKSIVIGLIRGTILLSQDNYTTVTIDSFAWSNSNIEVDTNNGSLVMTGDCKLDNRKIASALPGTLSVYPNPTDGRVNIKADKSTVKELGKLVNEVIVTDNLGRDCSYAIAGSRTIAADNTIELNLEGLSPGTYFLLVNICGEIYPLRIVRY